MKKAKKKASLKIPKGSGFGKKKSTNPTYTPDTGRSTAKAEAIAAVSEGPISGPVDGLQSVYLDKTPIQNEDGSLNFEGVEYHFRGGTPDQEYIPGFGDEVTSEYAVSVEVQHNIPITRTVINKNIDGIRLRLGAILQQVKDDGSTTGGEVAFSVELKSGSGSFITVINTSISGKYSSLTEFEYQIPIDTQNGSISNFQIRLSRLTPTAENTSTTQIQLRWQTYLEVIEEKFNYPYTAYFALRFDAEQFDSIPEISYLVSGREIQIPSNATITSDGGLDYSGLWDGTFKIVSGATSDPAWILWDLITNRRYGLGRQISSEQLDRYSFYKISTYCNEYVSDGQGGQERRYLINCILKDRKGAYEVLSAIRSVFRGFSFWQNNAIAFIADQPDTVTGQFTQADVEDGMFSYTGTGLKARHSVALVTWNDPDNYYERAIEAVEDQESIDLYGIKYLEISAFGCTSRGQARRAGLAALLAERLETETVTFKARAYAARINPGAIIQIMDAIATNARNGGLIVSATINSIKLDYPVTIDSNSNLVTIMSSDGTIAERTITNGPGNYDELFVAPDFPSIPIRDSNWIVSSATVKPKLFRVLNRIPVQGSAGMLQEITAVSYNIEKFSAIDFNTQLSQLQTTTQQNQVPSAPTNISLSIRGNSVDISWKIPRNEGNIRDPFISATIIEVNTGEFWGSSTSLLSPSENFTFNNLIPGLYQFRLKSQDLRNQTSQYTYTGQYTIT